MQIVSFSDIFKHYKMHEKHLTHYDRIMDRPGDIFVDMFVNWKNKTFSHG